MNAVISRFYYQIHVKSTTKIFLNLFQDEDIYKENDSRKQRMDLALTILKLENNSGEVSHIYSTPFVIQQYIQIEQTFVPGSYIILPRTTGCCCFRRDFPLSAFSEPTILYDHTQNKLTPIFISTLKDIFKKFDISQNKSLKYDEFKAFWKTVEDKEITEEKFKNTILYKYTRSSDSLSEKGFINFMQDMYISKDGGEVKLINNNFYPL